MKALFAVCILSLSSAASYAQASSYIRQKPDDADYVVVERGPNHTVWEKMSYEMDPQGDAMPTKHRYTELSTGLNHWSNGQWRESKAQIDILPQGGAAAVHGQHHVYFPVDIYQGAIQMLEPGGEWIQSRPLGVSYDDGTNTVLIAELKNSVGSLVSSNQIVYSDAFTGIKADLRYTYTKAGFEQDIILREQPRTPESYGLNPGTARLQILTEFFDSPKPRVVTTVLPAQAGLTLLDNTLDFGQMRMVPGRAFLLGDAYGDDGVMVAKNWLLLDGRQFLVEEVPVDALADKLAALPIGQETSSKNVKGNIQRVASGKLKLPPQHLAISDTKNESMRVAEAAGRKKGIVLDYRTILGTMTNVTFQGDTTYYISGNVTLAGTNTFEGNAVIKFATNTTITISGGARLNWQAADYRPVIFTAIDDDSVGETISGSTGIPSGYYASSALTFSGNDLPVLSNFKIAYAKFGIEVGLSSTGITNGIFYNAQFISCKCAIDGDVGRAFFGNVLFANIRTNFFDSSDTPQPSSTFVLQNSTFSGVTTIAVAGFGAQTLNFTNCILVNVTNLNGSKTMFTINGSKNGLYKCPTLGINVLTNTFYPFQTVGAGGYYLTNGTSFRNAGATNIDSWLQASLKRKTTYPPIVYSNSVISTATVFNPQALRDTNSVPDLGYHYNPLDYVFGAVTASSNLTFTAGTVAGWFYNASGGTYGIALGDSATASFNGTVASPCRWVKYDTVQEGENGTWTAQSWLGGITGQSYTYAPPAIRAQFTMCSLPANEGNVFRDNWTLLTINANHCEFYSGSPGGYYASENFTNCLFVNTAPVLWWNYGAANLTLINCTLFRGNLTADHAGTGNWPVTIFNCTFDGTTNYMNPEGYGTNGAYCDFNAFSSNASSLYFSGAHDITNVPSFGWQGGALGNYYLPTNSPLVNMGSATADQLGLFHFTTQTNQAKELNSIVDIGYHYVAVSSGGTAIDSNGDGIPDYLEDANGDGVADNGETNWLPAILISSQPTDQVAVQTGSAAFTVVADGTGPLVYQWYFNAAPISGATNTTLTISNAQSGNAGPYYVVITNTTTLTSLASSNAVLTVVPSPTISITNPVNNAVFKVSQTNLTLKATVSDSFGVVTQVQFFAGSASVGIVTTTPYNVVWSNAPAGSYHLTAVSYDDKGYFATSSIVNITISPLFTTNTALIWLKADAIAGLTNNAPVATWVDSSGWTNNATQTSLPSEPAYVTNLLNGLPVVRFNATNGNILNLPSSLLNNTTGAEAFAVVKATGAPGGWYTLWRFGTTETYGRPAYPYGDGNINDDFCSSSVYTVGVPPQSFAQYHVYNVASTAGYWGAWVNGINLFGTTNNGYAYRSGYQLGSDPRYGGTYWSGDIAEILIFNRTLTDAEKMIINGYLGMKYGLVGLPATPTNLLAMAVSSSQISLTWNFALTNSSVSFQIERKTGTNGTYSQVTTVRDATAYVDTNLTAGVQYYYRVKAGNVAGDSGYSNETNAITLSSGTDVPFGNLLLWLKADGGVVRGGISNNVGRWMDKSGGYNDGTQPSSAYQPQWIDGALNGRPVVRFNATNSQALGFPSAMLNNTTGLEGFVVLKAAVNYPGSYRSLWEWGAAHTPSYYPAISGNIVEDFGSYSLYDLGVPVQPLNQYHLYNVAGQNYFWAAWINGATLYSTVNNYYGTWGTYSLGVDIGGGEHFDGDVAEILVFNRVLTSAERDAVSSYLVGKYNLGQYAISTSAPAAPTNLTATGMAPYQLNLRWTESSTNVTSFHVERELGTNGVFTDIGTVWSQTTNFIDTTANPTNVYYYRIRAHNLFADSYSSLISPPTVAITNWPVTTIQQTTNYVYVQAGDVNGTITQVQLVGNGTWWGSVTTAPYVFSWIPPLGTSYSLAVLATDSLGNSQYSAAATSTVYLDSNGDGIPDYLQVTQGNDPINPWTAPPPDTNDVTAPVITLLVPTNAVVIP